MSKNISLAEEITAALELLRAHELHRAANRLEQMSRKILHGETSKPPRVKVSSIVSASGRTFKIPRVPSVDAETIDYIFQEFQNPK